MDAPAETSDAVDQQMQALLEMPHLELAAFALQVIQNQERAIATATARAISEHQRRKAQHKRPNALAELVEAILLEEPAATTSFVLRRLGTLEGTSIVEEVNHVAGIVDWYCSRRRKVVLTPISALPSMISRARKKLRVMACV